jgi:hypothetical protein
MESLAMSKTVFVRLCLGLVLLTTALTASPASAQPFDPNAYYVIRNVGGNKVLDVSQAGCCNGAWLHIWNYDNRTNQQWRIVDIGGGYYTIEARHSGRVADVEGASGSDGARVHQWDYDGFPNQEWQIVPTGDGSYYIVARHSGKVMTAAGSVFSNGTSVRQYDIVDWSASNNRWRIELVP